MSEHGSPIPLYILAGGRSSRFGSDKARALYKGRPLVLEVASALAARAASVTVVAEVDGKYADLGLRTIADRRPGLGPLAGLHAALLDSDSPDWLLLSSCDWTGLNPDWIDLLSRARDPDKSAVSFRSGVWEPLLALYHRRLRSTVAARLEDGRLSLWRLLEDCAVALALPDDWSRARQVNCPADLADLDDSRPTGGSEPGAV